MHERRIRFQPDFVTRIELMTFAEHGDNLLAATTERDWMVSTSTYGQRSVETNRLPGVLLGGLTFTL